MFNVFSFNPFVIVVVLAAWVLVAALSRSFRAFAVGLVTAAMAVAVSGTLLTGALTPVAFVIGFVAFWPTAAWAMKSL